MSRTRRFWPLTLVVGMFFALAACGGDEPTATQPPAQSTQPPQATAPLPEWQSKWNTIVEAAKAEGEVMVWVDEGVEERAFYKDAFEAAYPEIKVNLFQTARSAERIQRYRDEKKAGVAKLDVLFTGGGDPNRIGPEGLLQDIRPFLILPEVADPSNWRDNEILWADRETAKWGLSATHTTSASLVVNKDVDPNQFQSYADLLDPKWKGKITMGDPLKGGGGYAMGLFLYHIEGMGPEFTKRFYSEMGIAFTTDDRQKSESVATGKYLIDASPSQREYAKLLADGFQFHIIKSLKTLDGKKRSRVTASPGVVMVPSIDPLPHPNAATVYVNWFLTKDGQQKYMAIMEVASRRKDVDTSKLPPTIVLEDDVEYHDMTPLANPADTKSMRDDVSANLPK